MQDKSVSTEGSSAKDDGVVRRSEGVLVLLAVVMALAATVCFDYILHASDTNRRAQFAVQRLAAVAYRLGVDEQIVVSRRSANFEMRMRVANDEQDGSAQLSTIGSLTLDPRICRPVIDQYVKLQKQVDHVVNAAAKSSDSDDLSAAVASQENDFDRLNTDVDNTAMTLDQSSRKMKVVSASGSVSFLITMLLILAAVFNRFERRREEATIMSTERGYLRKSEARFHSLVANAADIIIIMDRVGAIRYVSPATLKMLGINPSSLLGSKVYNIIHPDDVPHAHNIVDQSVQAAGTNVSSEVRLLHVDGSCRHAEVILINQLTVPEVGGIIATFGDITDRRQFEEQLTHHAFHDALTGLPNRALFMDRLTLALYRTSRNDNPVAVIFIDLDNFKIVNDSLGHQAGDQLLLNVTERLQTCLRPDDTLARLGGDEFTVLIESSDRESASRVAERVVAVLDAPFRIEGHDCFTSASIGIAMSGGADDSPQILLRDADTAMYEAKTSGKGRFSIFDSSMSDKASERLEFESDLRTAVEREEVRVFYQPVISLTDERISGFEALMRWQHPTKGLLPPIKFIPLAEEMGAIIPLGRYVIEEACRQLKEWQTAYHDVQRLTMSVNLSPKQFQHPELVNDVRQAIESAGVKACDIKLEITESITIADPQLACRKLEQLKALGVQIAIDDFGTGYSSMAYLKSLPIDTIKIDRSFVSRLGGEAEDEAIVNAIITLAKTMRLAITSEGIETAEQLERLQALGCDEGQGFYFSEPVHKTQIEAIMGARSSGSRSPLRRAA